MYDSYFVALRKREGARARGHCIGWIYQSLGELLCNSLLYVTQPDGR